MEIYIICFLLCVITGMAGYQIGKERRPAVHMEQRTLTEKESEELAQIINLLAFTGDPQKGWSEHGDKETA